MVVCGDEVVIAAMDNAAGVDDVVATDYVVTVDDVSVAIGAIAVVEV